MYRQPSPPPLPRFCTSAEWEFFYFVNVSLEKAQIIFAFLRKKIAIQKINKQNGYKNTFSILSTKLT